MSTIMRMVNLYGWIIAYVLSQNWRVWYWYLIDHIRISVDENCRVPPFWTFTLGLPCGLIGLSDSNFYWWFCGVFN